MSLIIVSKLLLLGIAIMITISPSSLAGNFGIQSCSQAVNIFLPELYAELRQKISGSMRLDARTNVVSVGLDNGEIFSILMSQLVMDKEADFAAELENIALERE